MGRQDIAETFNIAALDLKCVLLHPQFSEIIKGHRKANGGRCSCACEELLPVSYRRIPPEKLSARDRKKGAVVKLRGIGDISEAVRLTMERIETEKIYALFSSMSFAGLPERASEKSPAKLETNDIYCLEKMRSFAFSDQRLALAVSLYSTPAFIRYLRQLRRPWAFWYTMLSVLLWVMEL
jgi:hypothetical protein